MKLNSTRKGYYEVHVDGKKQSKHTSVTEVIAKGFELKSNNLGAEVRIKQPDLLIDVELSDNIEELKDRIRELEKSEAMYIQIIESLSGGGGSQSVDVTSVTIEPSTATISVGETQQLKETILPANASDKTGVWSTSNANATVSQNGLVTAVTEGSSIITFTTTDGSFTDTTTVTVVQAEVKAFPTALGGGSTSRGDVTYTLREVTNLNSTGYGSFWDAFQSNSIVVFRVSGVIDLDIFSTKTVNNVIILGQTAPEGGITITGQRLRFQNSNNVIIRYVRFRPEGTGNDTLDWIDSDNIILDHCSLSFGGDETITFRGDSDNTNTL